MRTHESKAFKGGIIASLATPWGFARGDGDLGYHLIWPRDMIETVTALLAARRHEDARRVLFYFCVTQDADGHWPQNMEVSGRPWWDGIQLDETAFVILLVALARREKALADDGVEFLWPMVRRAVGYLVRHGPVTPLDRWEEESGYFASTMAVEIPALLVAADLADAHGEKEMGAVPARDRRRLERRHRRPDLRDGHGPGPEGRRGRLLRPLRHAGPDGGVGAGVRRRRSQEPRFPDRAASPSPISSARTP